MQQRQEYDGGMDDGSIGRLQSVTMIGPVVTQMRLVGWQHTMAGDFNGPARLIKQESGGLA